MGGTIKKDNYILKAVIPISVKDELQKRADLEDRSLSNYVAKILKDFIKEDSRG